MTEQATTLLELAEALALSGNLGPPVGADEVLGPPIGSDDSAGLGPSVGADEIGISDCRLKTDIRRVGSTAFGLPLYDFRYIGGKEVYRGVMAQDVLSVMPDAVVTGDDGFMRVHYGMLGAVMRRVA